MTEKYTPGPWRISEQSPTIIKVDNRRIGTDWGLLVCSIMGYSGSGFFPPEEEARANASLIAAAPEMLEVLMLIESVYRQNCVNEGEPSSVLEAVQAVIAKALGEGK